MLSVVAFAWSSVLAVVAMWAAIRTRAPARRARPLGSGGDRASLASVLLLRPCAGREPHLARALLSSRVADPGVQVRFLVAQASDGATPELTRAIAELLAEGRDARVVVTSANAPNMKAHQLARAVELEAERSAVVVVADSDVELTSGVLSAVLAPLASGDAHAAWVPPVETCPATRADRASAGVLDASLHAFPLLAGLDAAGMVGKLFAVRRDALDAVGGFPSVVDHLGEDVELSRRLRRAGFRVVPCPVVVGSLASGRSWRDVLHRYARWIAVVRGQRPLLLVSYPLLLAATPLILALAVAGWVHDGRVGAGVIAFVLGVRLGIAVLARRRAGRAVQPARALVRGLVADGLLLAAFVWALSSREITWRGARLALAREGVLERVPMERVR